MDERIATNEDRHGLRTEFAARHPGRDAQRVGTARYLEEPIAAVHGAPWGAIGTLGESQCYLGVRAKVDAVHRALSQRIRADGLDVRLVPPAFTLGISDGQLNGTERMRYSLVSREVVREATELHLAATDMRGTIAIVACDKPPVGTLAAVLEHNQPAVMCPDGSILPGTDPVTGDRLDIVDVFQRAAAPIDERTRTALHGCPGHGSCGGMFTYNTMQVVVAVAGMTPLHMVSPPSVHPDRVGEFPDELAALLATLASTSLRPRDIVTPVALRNALVIALAMGGSTNVVLHTAELARAAGFDLWDDVVSRDELVDLGRRVPVLTDLRPYGRYSMADVHQAGGLAVIVRELLDDGWIDGSTTTCTNSSLGDQIDRLDPPAPDGSVVHPVKAPFKRAGGLRVLHGNLAPDGTAVLKLAGVERGLDDRGRFVGRARVFDSEAALLAVLTDRPESFGDGDMVVIRYEGPRGAPGMPEMLDPTSRITALCREREITVGLMTDARFSGGSVGLVIGHVGPEAAVGGPIALLEDGDTIVVDVEASRLDCLELDDQSVADERRHRWQTAAAGGAHPSVRPVERSLLRRMRATARPALAGGGMAIDGGSAPAHGPKARSRTAGSSVVVA
ncbi:MAG: dihydroxy-acid dehydratase [Actinomycetota bacterium]